jgi:hypothetical protein
MSRSPFWLVEPPKNSAGQRRRQESRCAATVRDVLTAELPDAFAILLARETP